MSTPSPRPSPPGADATLGDRGARAAALRTVKLEALVSSRWGREERRRASFPLGAALVAGDTPGGTAWVYVAENPSRGLGAALAWAERRGVGEAAGGALHLLVDEESAALARRAGQFARPEITVWSVVGAALVPAEPAPAPALASEPAQPAPQELVDLLLDAGVEVVVEGGIVRGEVNGLEVARIVHGETTAGVPIERPLLEVGVGAADREMTALVHGELTPEEQLFRVVEIVRRHRRPGAPRHPLNELVPERWLRAGLCRDAGALGLATLRPAEGAQPRPNLRDRGVAVASGTTAEGGPVVVTCSVGIDLDLVPAAADARLAVAPDAELWLVVPERDDHPGTRRLAGSLREPARVVPVPGDWRALGS